MKMHVQEWSELFLLLLLLLNLTRLNWAVMGDAEKTQDRQTERKFGARCVGCLDGAPYSFAVL
jgi:hypothetical protein